MDNESKFWLGFFAIIGAVILGISFSISWYWSDHNAKVVQLISDGVDPVAAMRAMQDDYGNHPTCIILATKRDIEI